jgi:hypothetical protein
MLILNAPPGYIERLAPLPPDIEIFQTPEGQFDFVHLFVRSISQLEESAAVAIEAAGYDGLLWFSYPKKSSKVETDLSRDVGWDVVIEAGLRPVTQVSVDETWSALRWRPIQAVGKKAR